MNPGRRRALRVLAGTGVATAATTAPVQAARLRRQVSPDAVGMLYDTTRCIGCKACVVACREANGLPPDTSLDGIHQAPLDLNARTKNVIKLYREGERVSFFKAQCMHCVDPACASACMLHSLSKDEKTGIVSYDPQYCVGCRYCEMACPFNVPKFEWVSTTPKIVKCEMCRHLLAQGKIPACCEVCPRHAVIFGTRKELLAEAKRRLAAEPDRYVPHVYGETEAGGTQVLYLSHVPFEKLGLPAYGPEGVPETAYTIQEGLYQGFVAPVVLYAALGAVLWRNRTKGGPGEGKP
ncbi:MAG TPA: hydrogenase 2 operon protein HybA [Vicinamibacteria bacterium]|nr:hydrogenase 2 operon protein HybA [Vicinamibacteria bacterium]